MNKSENVLTKVHNQEIFDDIYVLDNEKDIILNSITIYSLKENIVDKRINYDIQVNGNKQIIRPLEYAQKYVICFERLVSATIIRIDAKDYFDKTEKDRSFTFYM